MFGLFSEIPLKFQSKSKNPDPGGKYITNPPDPEHGSNKFALLCLMNKTKFEVWVKNLFLQSLYSDQQLRRVKPWEKPHEASVEVLHCSGLHAKVHT
jgi:hypothetical protein